MVDPNEQTAVAKVLRRQLPIAMFLFFVSLIDRANISFAGLQMNQDLHLNPEIYGAAAGIFFIGYVLFEVPSNLILMRVGARRWIGRIMISWGVVAAAMALVVGPNSLYAARFLLGVAEAGLLPGLLYYLTLWIPARKQAATFSIVMATTAIAYIVGGPLATGLMALDGLFGLRGWQLMFIIEGVPAIVVGVLVMAFLAERLESVAWLTAPEKQALRTAIDRENVLKSARGVSTVREGLLDRRVLVAGLFTFFMICDNFGTVFWLPQIIKSLGTLSNLEVGFLSVIPYICAGIGMVVWGRHADRSGDRKWHLIAGAALAAAGYACAGLAPSSVLSFVAICVAALGVWSMFGVIWAYSADLLGGGAAASGFALINSLGTVGGFVGPFIIGYVRQRTTSFSEALLVMAGFALVTAVTGLLLKDTRQDQGALGAAAVGVGD